MRRAEFDIGHHKKNHSLVLWRSGDFILGLSISVRVELH